jgi:hypothetical protein
MAAKSSRVAQTPPYLTAVTAASGESLLFNSLLAEVL